MKNLCRAATLIFIFIFLRGTFTQILFITTEADTSNIQNSITPDVSQWVPSLWGGAKITRNNGITITTNSSFDMSGVEVYTNYRFTGDFDVQVDYGEGMGWDGEYASYRNDPHILAAEMGIYAGGSKYTILRYIDYYKGRLNHNLAVFDTVSWANLRWEQTSSSNSGKFRIIRTGSNVEFQSWRDSYWFGYYSISSIDKPVSIYLGAECTWTNHTFSTIFENFKINSGTISNATQQAPEIPFGWIDSTKHGATLTGAATIEGWAASKVGIEKVEVMLDNQNLGQAVYGLARQDVEAVYPNLPDTPNFGYTFEIDTTKFPNGKHTLQVQFFDKSGNMDYLTIEVYLNNNVSGEPPEESHTMTLRTNGVQADYTPPILTLDGVEYSVSQLPLNVTGSTHDYSWKPILEVDKGVRYVLTSTHGLSDTAQGEVTVTEDGGYLEASYQIQSYIDVQQSRGGSVAPAGGMWINQSDNIQLIAKPDEGYRFVKWYSPGFSLSEVNNPSIILSLYGSGSVTAIFEDTLSPTLSIESPVNGGTYWTRGVLIGGLYSDNGGINKESVNLVIDGARVTSGLYIGDRLMIYDTSLSLGIHAVQLTVEDLGGNAVTATSSFTVIPVEFIVIPVVIGVAVILSVWRLKHMK